MDMNLETKRNLFHLILGISVIALLYLEILNAWILLGILLAGFVASMASRKRRVPVIGWLLDVFERKDVLDTFPGKGAFYITLGFLLSVALFPKDIALASIAILTFGDTVSYFFGVRAGRIRHPLSDRKFLEGSVSGFLAAFFAAQFFVLPTEALIAAGVAMTIEAIDFVKGKRVEDNIAIPLFAGLAITVMRALGL